MCETGCGCSTSWWTGGTATAAIPTESGTLLRPLPKGMLLRTPSPEPRFGASGILFSSGTAIAVGMCEGATMPAPAPCCGRACRRCVSGVSPAAAGATSVLAATQGEDHCNGGRFSGWISGNRSNTPTASASRANEIIVVHPRRDRFAQPASQGESANMVSSGKSNSYIKGHRWLALRRGEPQTKKAALCAACGNFSATRGVGSTASEAALFGASPE